MSVATPEQLAALPKRSPWPHGWHELSFVGTCGKRDALRIYARLGLTPILVHGILPDGRCTCGREDCSSAGKHPVARQWQRQAFDLENVDAGLVDRWQLNLGLRTGEQRDGSHLIVIDVDGERELLRPLEEKWGKLPTTLSAKTPRGFHFFFRSDKPVPNRARVVPGVDIRGTGGQVVCPPSLHRSGHVYRWLHIQRPEVLP